MVPPTATLLRIGDWCVNPSSRQISRDGETARVEERTMRLLLCLAQHAGELISIDDLLNHVWSDVTVSPDSVYQAVASLRRLLGDDPKRPTYIATVPRLGYRMVATVGPWADQLPNRSMADRTFTQTASAETANTEPGATNPGAIEPRATNPVPTSRPVLRAGLAWTGAALGLALLVALAFLLHSRAANNHQRGPAAFAAQPQKSIAVLPFLDLTEAMHEEEFADGMTEELIDKLSKIPGLQVPAPTSSFYFKGKKIPVTDIARTLGVAYILDGSVRQSGARLRVAARLIRADNGYIVWTETYDRSLDDVLMVQDDIAGEVTKALQASIQSTPDLPHPPVQ